MNQVPFCKISRLSITTCRLLRLPRSGPRPALPSHLVKQNLCQRYAHSSSSDSKPPKDRFEPINLNVEDEANNLTRISLDAPIQLRRQALDMYTQCKLSERDSVTRFAIARQMRNLDLPPHQELWQGINAKDELNLYRWIDEAFGQLMYQKGLWKPSRDWSPEDDQAEAEQRSENLRLLQVAYEEQIVNPLKKRFGDSEVTIALSALTEDQKLYCQPAVIWESVDPQTGVTSLEWMSQYTADVTWPGLVDCRAEYQFARRYWEAEAREFAKSIGGIACGMGENREMLPIISEEEQEALLRYPSSELQDPFESRPSSQFTSQANRHAAEAVLIKKFLEERNRSS